MVEIYQHSNVLNMTGWDPPLTLEDRNEHFLHDIFICDHGCDYYERTKTTLFSNEEYKQRKQNFLDKFSKNYSDMTITPETLYDYGTMNVLMGAEIGKKDGKEQCRTLVNSFIWILLIAGLILILISLIFLNDKYYTEWGLAYIVAAILLFIWITYKF